MGLVREYKITKRLLSVKEAAVYLGRSESAIRELEWAGKLRAVRIDRRIQFDIYDLDAFIEQHKESCYF